MMLNAKENPCPNEIVNAVTKFTRYRHKARGRARLSLVALYSIYSIFMGELKRYHGLKLLPLQPSPQVGNRSPYAGDINVIKSDGSYFESIIFHHRTPVWSGLVNYLDYHKIQHWKIGRYYILTTFEPSMKELDELTEVIEEIGRTRQCEIIADGFVPTFERYLLLLNHPADFVEIYTENLLYDIERNGGVRIEHFRVWNEIRREMLVKN